MELGLAGRRAWVLGGSSGLGRGTAAALHAEGAAVAISARPGRRLDETALALGVAAVPLDVAHGADAIQDACNAAVAQLGGLDIVVVNHGGPRPGGIDDVDGPAFAEAFDLVLASAFHVTKAVVPHLRANGGGVILYVTSSATKEIIPGLFLSNTMRAGVVGMMKTFSHELGPDGIRTLCIAPGRIATDRAAAVDEATARAAGTTVEAARAASERSIPLGRYGRPAEFGGIAAFLCSERAAYLTGTTVVVDGGKLFGITS